MLPSSAEQREASKLYGAVVDESFPHGTLDAKFWSFPGVTGLKVRGPNYLQARLITDCRIHEGFTCLIPTTTASM